MAFSPHPWRRLVTHDPHAFLITKLRNYVPAAGSDDEIMALRVGSSGLDSLDLMELLNEIEETFEIRVEDDTVSADTTVAQLAEFIQRSVERRRA
jgi:acyl carrier protein